MGALLEAQGVLLESAKGPIPNVAQLVAGEPITGILDAAARLDEAAATNVLPPILQPQDTSETDGG
jgi:hypothetical protein